MQPNKRCSRRAARIGGGELGSMIHRMSPGYTSEHYASPRDPQAPEGKTLEFKRNPFSTDAALSMNVAFANMASGTLLVGVEDRSRHIRHVSNGLDLEERLANLVSGRINPRIAPGIPNRCADAEPIEQPRHFARGEA